MVETYPPLVRSFDNPAIPKPNIPANVGIHFGSAPPIESAEPLLAMRIDSPESLKALRKALRELCTDIPSLTENTGLIATAVGEAVSNALRSSEEECCEVLAAATPHAALTVDVIDHGPGIPWDKVVECLQPERSGYDSLGWGMSLMSELCEQLHIYDVPQKGLTVRLAF